MGVYKMPNGVQRIEFVIAGIIYRKSAKTKSRELALQIENTWRNEIVAGMNGIKPKAKPLMFKEALDKFIENGQLRWTNRNSQKLTKKGLPINGSTERMHERSKRFIVPFFGNMFLTEITDQHIRDYQTLRKSQLSTRTNKIPSNRTINTELTTVRQVMSENKMWLRMMEGSTVKFLKPRKDIGRELTDDEARRLLLACRHSNSTMLFPAVMLSIYTGLRSRELRTLTWSQIDFNYHELTVGESKNDSSTGRIVNLNSKAVTLLQDWHKQFPDSVPSHCVFPSMRFRCIGTKGIKGGKVRMHQVFPTVPVTTLYGSWDKAREQAGVDCRWHDLRHTCASHLARTGATDQTIMEQLGWMSVEMLRHYSHVRAQARRTMVAKAFDEWNVLAEFNVQETQLTTEVIQ